MRKAVRNRRSTKIVVTRDIRLRRKLEPFLLEGVQVIVVEFEEGAKFEVGGAPFWEMGLIVDGDGYAGHAGCFCSDEAIE
jgi:hypothetical protein